MSQAIVAQVRAKYPTPLGEQHLACLEELARALGLGLVSKTSGTFIPHPTAGGVSQDVLMARNGDGWDVFRDAEGAAEPQFNMLPGKLDLFRYVEVGGQPVPEPPPSDPTLAELARKVQGVITRLDSLAEKMKEWAE